MSQQNEIVSVGLESVVRDPAMQVRNRMEDRLVRDYAKAMENGAAFPPIQLAEVNGALLLVDGWHRHAAAHSIGREVMDAVVTKMTRKEAQKASATANTRHGKPLKSSEYRTAFKNFIKGGGHKRTDGKLMSYRDLATALGGQVGHTTIRNWMRKYFPRIADAYGPEGPHGSSTAEPPRIDVEGNNFRQTRQALTDALNLYRLLGNPENRYMIIRQAERALSLMKIAKHSPPDF